MSLVHNKKVHNNYKKRFIFIFFYYVRTLGITLFIIHIIIHSSPLPYPNILAAFV